MNFMLNKIKFSISPFLCVIKTVKSAQHYTISGALGKCIFSAIAFFSGEGVYHLRRSHPQWGGVLPPHTPLA